MFLTVQLLHNLLFGYHGNLYSYNVYRKWAKVEKHIFRVLAFKTEWKYLFLISHGQFPPKHRPVIPPFSPIGNNVIMEVALVGEIRCTFPLRYIYVIESFISF